MASPNFELITELQTCLRRDFPVAASQSTIINPTDAAPLIEGEWLEFSTTAGEEYTLKRGAAGEGTQAMVFPVHTEKGRYDTQAIGKVNVIFLGMYEAETLVHPLSLSGYAVGDALTVQDVNYAGYASRRGLAKQSGTLDERIIVGYISKITGSGAAAKLRFVHFGNQKITAV